MTDGPAAPPAACAAGYRGGAGGHAAVRAGAGPAPGVAGAGARRGGRGRVAERRSAAPSCSASSGGPGRRVEAGIGLQAGGRQAGGHTGGQAGGQAGRQACVLFHTNRCKPFPLGREPGRSRAQQAAAPIYSPFRFFWRPPAGTPQRSALPYPCLFFALPAGSEAAPFHCSKLQGSAAAVGWVSSRCSGIFLSSTPIGFLDIVNMIITFCRYKTANLKSRGQGLTTQPEQQEQSELGWPAALRPGQHTKHRGACSITVAEQIRGAVRA